MEDPHASELRQGGREGGQPIATEIEFAVIIFYLVVLELALMVCFIFFIFSGVESETCEEENRKTKKSVQQEQQRDGTWVRVQHASEQKRQLRLVCVGG